jgi:hypothetical protein
MQNNNIFKGKDGFWFAGEVNAIGEPTGSARGWNGFWFKTKKQAIGFLALLEKEETKENEIKKEIYLLSNKHK